VFATTRGIHAYRRSADFDIASLRQIDADATAAARKYLPSVEYENWSGVRDVDAARIKSHKPAAGSEDKREKELLWSSLWCGEQFLKGRYKAITGQDLTH
jgi:hypothetical protein